MTTLAAARLALIVLLGTAAVLKARDLLERTLGWLNGLAIVGEVICVGLLVVPETQYVGSVSSLAMGIGFCAYHIPVRGWRPGSPWAVAGRGAGTVGGCGCLGNRVPLSERSAGWLAISVAVLGVLAILTRATEYSVRAVVALGLLLVGSSALLLLFGMLDGRPGPRYADLRLSIVGSRKLTWLPSETRSWLGDRAVREGRNATVREDVIVDGRLLHVEIRASRGIVRTSRVSVDVVPLLSFVGESSEAMIEDVGARFRPRAASREMSGDCGCNQQVRRWPGVGAVAPQS